MSALRLELPDDALEAIARRAAALLAERTTAPEPWLDVAGAARHLGYSDLNRGKRRVYDLVALGQLHPHRDGKRLLFRPRDLDHYLEGK